MVLTPERIRELWENYSPTQGIESFARSVEAAALESQSREIAALKEQEAQLCTLYGLAEAECKRLRVKAARYDWLRDDADHMRVKKGSPQVCLTDKWGCLVGIGQWVYPRGAELDDAIDAAIAAKGGGDG